MSRNRRKHHNQSVGGEATAEEASLQLLPKWLLPFLFGAFLAAVIAVVAHEPDQGAPRGDAASPAQQDLPTLGELALMPASELAKQDLALLNLRCASDLPGAERLDVEKCLASLDGWAESVRHETERHLYKYRNHPAEFKNSEGYFRMLMLITVLQQDFNVHYNPERIRTVDFTNSQDLFLHGMIPSSRAKANGGTCVSLPVLYTAVARRLGYPVSLVAAKEHVFCRWESPEDRFNIEATNQGLSCYDDEYYKTWPKPMTEAEVESGLYLKSLDAAEAFAMFLAARGHCLEDNHSGAKARVAYAMAAEKQAQNPLYFGYLAQTMSPPRTIQEQFTPQHPAAQPMVFQPNARPIGRAASDPYSHDVFKPNLPVDPVTERQTFIPQPFETTFPH